MALHRAEEEQDGQAENPQRARGASRAGGPQVVAGRDSRGLRAGPQSRNLWPVHGRRES